MRLWDRGRIRPAIRHSLTPSLAHSLTLPLLHRAPTLIRKVLTLAIWAVLVKKFLGPLTGLSHLVTVRKP